ncbi:4Fe-4S binding protein [Leptospirillum ferriphilum]|jgi:ferredoxin|uniref:4Fe-4S ferredoxin-type domain-containing protein n=1 Tax=Leptospirillum ferriphilum TaxID=178606 RepID=A0A1V3SWM1_9BACT|nr:hypothetical protein ABH19_10295 [Leptospirillum sp. Group II 'CF-1']EAY56742.1 MAG: probable ferredoxin [Leptospirillum rubarum]EIJ76666.1 MAG: putative ferredoxin [Leptospirillum sp. Group II 'C75']OOH73654.1 hypothetical protein BOX24_03230 [Leptospirillum ferriphilum]OOH76281.1 hypothetical protein BOX30_10920 [Leptospirillum ferriphilum]
MKVIAGEKIRVDDSLCTNCGECEEICPTGVLSVRGEKKDALCILCRYCVVSCPLAALSVTQKG